MIKELIQTKKKYYINTGEGPAFQIIDINDPDYLCLINADTAFWALISKQEIDQVIANKIFCESFLEKSAKFYKEMNNLRFNLKPQAVYFNPTDLCNLNCKYCYIPEDIRKNGSSMSEKQLLKALAILKTFFKEILPKNKKPQIIFHGSEPLLNKDAVFSGIEAYSNDFQFGIQTNATLLDQATINFIKQHKVAVGISIDGHTAEIADQTRVNWEGNGYFKQTIKVMEQLVGYKNYSVICTLTNKNIEQAEEIINFFHKNNVSVCMLNILRCTQEYSRALKPDEEIAGHYYIKALERTYQLYQETGRKMVVANFANILLSIMAPTARRLMCDISPCGGGRCFFAVSARGDVFPCSEFIGLNEFNSGNIFKSKINDILKSDSINLVTSRQVENIKPCAKCAIRHFCGAPCPAEAFNMNGGRDQLGAFCYFYEEQVRYAFRLIANQKQDAFLYDNWDQRTEVIYDWSML